MYNEQREILVRSIRAYIFMYNATKFEHYLDQAVNVMSVLKQLNEQNQSDFNNLLPLQIKRQELNEFLEETIYNKVA